ncbi:MAG TPA: hypothetical protein H9881_14430 [Candidatus Stackebrandtia excrementipullorum]|nr:hypothetical protein [Candidatus Stackebrandtia excrementipullorum]
MENDLPAIRRCGSAIQDCGRAVSDHLTDNTDGLTVSGNTGFVTVGEVAAITPDWTDQLSGFSRRLTSIGRIMKVSADDFDEGDVETALRIQESEPQVT